MKKALIVILLAVFALAGFWALKKFANKAEPIAKLTTMKATEGQSYWTCPMHPQIHSEHPGECPICHMKLVRAKANQMQAVDKMSDRRGTVRATSDQLALLGIQKTEVEKMNLKIKIPVSGHFVSSSAVAFQSYESDLRYVRPGLSFSGQSSFYPDQKVAGTISSVDPIVDPTSRTVRVIGQVKTGPRNVLPETGFRGDIEFSLQDRVAIPESSVLHTGSGDLVYVFVNDNELKPREVALGLKSEGFYDVLDGLEPGEVISSGPNFLIDSESKIRAISDEPAGAVEDQPSKNPSCPKGQHWDLPMSMCMPGER